MVYKSLDMKLLLFLLFSLSLQAQVSNFTIENNNLIWSKVYNDSVSSENLLKIVRTKGKFDQINLANNEINFTLQYSNSDLKPYGYKYMTGAIFLQTGGTCIGLIEFKENRYKVSVYSIKINPDSEEDSKEYPLSEYALKKGEIKKIGTIRKALEFYDGYLTDVFSSKTVNKDW